MPASHAKCSVSVESHTEYASQSSRQSTTLVPLLLSPPRPRRQAVAHIPPRPSALPINGLCLQAVLSRSGCTVSGRHPVVRQCGYVAINSVACSSAEQRQNSSAQGAPCRSDSRPQSQTPQRTSHQPPSASFCLQAASASAWGFVHCASICSCTMAAVLSCMGAASAACPPLNPPETLLPRRRLYQSSTSKSWASPSPCTASRHLPQCRKSARS